jgi:hypothetical protein
MGVKLAAASGGSIELVPTNTASPFTVTVPAVTGTMLTTATAGTILQVVSASTITSVSNSTTTYADTGLTATITPSSATSKILVLISQATYKSSANTSSGVNIKLFRDATDLGRVIYAQGYTNSAIELYSQAAVQLFDSPASTSALTYKTQFANNVNAALVSVQPDSGGRSIITLMEIAA